MHNFGEPLNKPTIEICKAKEGLNISYPSGRLPFLNCGHFPLIRGNTFGRDDVVEKFYNSLLEYAFLIFGVKIVFPKF